MKKLSGNLFGVGILGNVLLQVSILCFDVPRNRLTLTLAILFLTLTILSFLLNRR